MKYIIKYERYRYPKPNNFPDVKISDEIKDNNFKIFNLYDLQDECEDYGVNFFEVVKEIVLNRKIAFNCTWCHYTDETDTTLFRPQKSHSIIGICEDIKEDQDDLGDFHTKDKSIIVKLKNDNYINAWHTLKPAKEWVEKIKKNRIRVYDYTEGEFMQELDIKKSARQYNI